MLVGRSKEKDVFIMDSSLEIRSTLIHSLFALRAPRRCESHPVLGYAQFRKNASHGDTAAQRKKH
jgi:hypothetical protein